MNKPPVFVDGKQICGAKNRQGNPCKRPPLEGKNRCNLHGGKTPKGIRNAETHGLHSMTSSFGANLAPEIKEIFDELRSDPRSSLLLDAAVLKARARRAIKKCEESEDGLYTTEKHRGQGPNGAIISIRKTDITATIAFALSRAAAMTKDAYEMPAATGEQSERQDDEELLRILNRIQAPKTVDDLEDGV